MRYSDDNSLCRYLYFFVSEMSIICCNEFSCKIIADGLVTLLLLGIVSVTVDIGVNDYTGLRLRLRVIHLSRGLR